MGNVTLRRIYEFESAHRLTGGLPETHPCRRPHGHSYQLTVWVGGQVDEDGFLIEYADLDKIIRPLWLMVDHHDLNTLLERCSTDEAALVSLNPTIERLVAWWARRLEGLVRSAAQGRPLFLKRLLLREDSRSSMEWTP
jgi:6-pyruvoyltetrahydropterin/6-carboxytetrahydropterin synthase